MTFRSLLVVLGMALALGLAVGNLRAGDTEVTFEEEPNDLVPEVLDMGPGAQPGEPVRFRIKGRIDTADDVDRFALDLNAGDVVGVVCTDTSGVDPRLDLTDPDGELLIGNDDKIFGLHTRWLTGPLPTPDDGDKRGDSILYVVIIEDGEYVLEVGGEDDTTGRYRLDIAVARPGLEAHPVGTKQILFVDFDGAKMDIGRYGLGASGTKTLSPMRDFLVHWGLTAADENAVIDAVLAVLKENLIDDIRDGGLNGDYASSGTPGEFGIEIRNSRDHADTYGTDPLVTRLIIGGTEAEAGINVWAASSGIDPGNLRTEGDSFVLLDRFTGLKAPPPGVPLNLNAIPIAAGRTKIELIGRALGNAGTHELGHLLGCWHTEFQNTTVNMMDQGGPVGSGAFAAAVGPDGIFGTADDIDRDFGVDEYASMRNRVSGAGRLFRGTNDTLNTIAFGLATGRR